MPFGAYFSLSVAIISRIVAIKQLLGDTIGISIVHSTLASDTK